MTRQRLSILLIYISHHPAFELDGGNVSAPSHNLSFLFNSTRITDPLADLAAEGNFVSTSFIFTSRLSFSDQSEWTLQG
jgi:hypothetical protein